jgi:hypothetical protein
VLDEETFIQTLETLADRVIEIEDLYPQAVTDGQVTDEAAYAKALANAREVQVVFGEQGADSEFEQQLQAVSVSVGEQAEGQAVRLRRLIEDQAPPADVLTITKDLLPNFNRLVLMARGQLAPPGVRQLRTVEAINAAVDEVIAEIKKAVEAYRAGDVKAAAHIANAAFFLFESNGLGTDLTIIDVEHENRAEAEISNFGPAAATNPGLEQLMAGGATMDAIEARLARAIEDLEVAREILLSTLPEMQLGDVNADGQVTVVDAMLIQQAVLGLRELDERAAAVADMNGDGQVNVVDAMLAAQMEAGLRERR